MRFLFTKKGNKESNILEGQIHSDIPNYLIHKVFDHIEQGFKVGMVSNHSVIISDDGLVTISHPGEIVYDSEGLIQVNRIMLDIKDDKIGLGKTFVKRSYYNRITENLESYQVYIDPDKPSPLLISNVDGNIFISPSNEDMQPTDTENISLEGQRKEKPTDAKKTTSAEKLLKNIEKDAKKAPGDSSSPLKKDPSGSNIPKIDEDEWV